MILNILNAVLVIIVTAAIAAIFYFTASKFFKDIYLPYKNNIYNSSFDELLAILRAVINTELESYENDIFITKGSITNSNFDNYYRDITNKIIQNTSPAMVEQLSRYVAEPMIYKIISRAVKRYLTEKINGTV